MKRLVLTILVGVGLIGSAIAQSKKMEDNFFLSFHSTVYFDVIWSKLYVENAPTGNIIIVDGKEVPEYKEIPFQSFTYNIFSFGLEPRYNIKTFDENSALAISSPISLGLGQVTAPPSDNAIGSIEGFGSLQIPLFAKLYVGSGSTYDCEKDYGVSFGFGFEYNKLGLIRLDGGEPAGPLNKGFVIPAASLGIHFWRGINPVEVNIKYAEGASKEYHFDKYGDPIMSSSGLSSGVGKARSFRMSISYILNY